MSDKKLCKNCGTSCDSVLQAPCKKWTRNPTLWLDIPPEQEGKWFYRDNPEDEDWKILTIFEIKTQHKNNAPGFYVEEDNGESEMPVKYYKGQFQGPIKPNDEKETK